MKEKSVSVDNSLESDGSDELKGIRYNLYLLLSGEI